MRARPWILTAALVACLVVWWGWGWGPSTGSPVSDEPSASNESRAARSDASVRVLLIGNSFTSANQLDRRLRSLLDAALPGGSHVRAIAPGGTRFDQHAAALDQLDSALSRALAERDPPWDAVVLQNQSQIPGFDPEQEQARASTEGLRRIAAALKTAGVKRAILYETWGYPLGDLRNPGLYPDFPTMQAKLTEGYRRYQKILTDSGLECDVAAVGQSFARVHAAELAAGRDPKLTRSPFARLYASDLTHPALPGTILAACTIGRSVLRRDVHPLGWRPAGLSPEDADRLARVADGAAARPPVEGSTKKSGR